MNDSIVSKRSPIAVSILAVAVSTMAALGCEVAYAAAPVQPPAASAKQLPPPQNITLTTRDGVSLGATFYPSLLGKEAVPVIMLHQYKGSRNDFKDLAATLQAKGCAVLVPDLRGHGQSTRQQLPNGGEREINVALLRQQDFVAMVDQDLEACKSFLMDKNNAGELNINKLCVIGEEMGAVVGVDWAAWDWHWPRLATGKQGQDVKALGAHFAALGLQRNQPDRGGQQPPPGRSMVVVDHCGRSG